MHQLDNSKQKNVTMYVRRIKVVSTVIYVISPEGPKFSTKKQLSINFLAKKDVKSMVYCERYQNSHFSNICLRGILKNIGILGYL